MSELGNRVIPVVSQPLPVFLWKRTSSGPVAMSQKCQQRKLPSLGNWLTVQPRRAPLPMIAGIGTTNSPAGVRKRVR